MPAVGSNLHDHFTTSTSWRCTRAITLNDLENSWPRKITAAIRYGLFRSGPMASNGVHAGVFSRSDPRLERPDLQIHIFEWSIQERTKDRIVADRFPGFTLSPVHLKPDGRGSVRLATPDPLAPPSIQFDFLRTDYDMRAIVPASGSPARSLHNRLCAPTSPRRSCPGQQRPRTLTSRRSCVRPGVGPPSQQHLRDGNRNEFGRRSEAARTRDWRPAGGGCIRHAVGRCRQHQCTQHHDRREGGSDDPGRCEGGVTRHPNARQPGRARSSPPPTPGEPASGCSTSAYSSRTPLLPKSNLTATRYRYLRYFGSPSV